MKKKKKIQFFIIRRMNIISNEIANPRPLLTARHKGILREFQINIAWNSRLMAQNFLAG